MELKYLIYQKWKFLNLKLCFVNCKKDSKKYNKINKNKEKSFNLLFKILYPI